MRRLLLLLGALASSSLQERGSQLGIWGIKEHISGLGLLRQNAV